MKVIVISDSHANIANLKQVMGFAKKIKAGAVIHCGDWNNIAAVKTVLLYRIPLYSVLGNADIDPEIEELLTMECKKFDRVFLEFELNERKIGVVHKLDIKHQPSVINCDIVFAGHTHKQVNKVVGAIRLINPGALEDDVNFAVYDTVLNKVELINEQI